MRIFILFRQQVSAYCVKQYYCADVGKHFVVEKLINGLLA